MPPSLEDKTARLIDELMAAVRREALGGDRPTREANEERVRKARERLERHILNDL